jgi:rare lipoprotein A
MRVRDAELNTRSMAAVRSVVGSRIVRLGGVTVLALAAANCSQVSSIDPKYGVAPSPKVVSDGQAVPKGGGRQMVGKPYTVAGKTYVPTENPAYANEGLASWYGSNFHGRLTANGEIFDRYSIAAAHATMPLPSYARITNLQNNHSIIVRVNDRGPYHGNRIVDVSERTAEALDFKKNGTAPVRVEYVGRASPNGSDDKILLASLRTDGQPASLTGQPATMIAQADARPNAPRTAIGLRTYETDEADEAVAEEVPAAPAVGQVVAGIPLPPERPFDLGTIPSAATPVRAAPLQLSAPAQAASPMLLPPARPAAATLSYAPVQTGFQKVSSFEPMDHRKFVGRPAQN